MTVVLVTSWHPKSGYNYHPLSSVKQLNSQTDLLCSIYAEIYLKRIFGTCAACVVNRRSIAVTGTEVLRFRIGTRSYMLLFSRCTSPRAGSGFGPFGPTTVYGACDLVRYCIVTIEHSYLKLCLQRNIKLPFLNEKIC